MTPLSLSLLSINIHEPSRAAFSAFTERPKTPITTTATTAINPHRLTLSTFTNLTYRIQRSLRHSNVQSGTRVLVVGKLGIPGAATIIAGLCVGATVIVGVHGKGVAEVMKEGGVKVCMVGREGLLAGLGGWEAADDKESLVVVVNAGDLLEKCYDHRDHLMSWEEFVQGEDGEVIHEGEEGWHRASGNGREGVEGKLVVGPGNGEDMEKMTTFSMEQVREGTLALARKLGVEKGDVYMSYMPLSMPPVVFLEIFAPLIIGTHTIFARRDGTLISSLKKIRPHVFLAVPHIWKQLLHRINDAVDNSSWRTRMVAAMETLLAKFGGAKAGIFENVKSTVGLENGRALGCLVENNDKLEKELIEGLKCIGLKVLEIDEENG